MHKFITLLMVLLPLIATARNSDNTKKPFWADGYFKDLGNSYLEVVSAFDYDIPGAREKATKELVRKRSIATGSEANVKIDGSNVSVTSDKDLIVKARVVSEFVEHAPNGYVVYQLVQTAKNPTYEYESVAFTTDYQVGARPLVPGMAQLYKGSKAKGYSIIAAQALSVAAIIFCESERSSNINKSVEQPKFAKQYKNRAKNWETGRNVSIGVAAAMYVYNVIDGYVAKGKPRIVTSRKGSGLSMAPYVTLDNAGIAFAFNF